MKVYTREALIKRFKVCMVLGVILDIVVIIANIALPIVAGVDIPVIVLLVSALSLVICAPIFAVCFLGMSFNFKKILIGFIAPIPILSYCIECFKAIYYGIKAVIVIVKKQDQFTIGSSAD